MEEFNHKEINQELKQFENTALNLPKQSTRYIQLKFTDDPHQVPSDHLQATCPQPFGTNPVVQAELVESRKLAEGNDVKTVYEATLELPSKVDFSPGDTIGVLARNRKEDVESLLASLGFDSVADRPCHLTVIPIKKSTKLPVFLPEHVTIRRALTECLDIKSVPKKLLLRELIEYTSDEDEERFLQILCSREGGQVYNDFIQKHNFFTLISGLKSCHPPFEVLLEHLPRLLPRPYSISNVSVNDDDRRLKFVFSCAGGLVTDWLEQMILDGARDKKMVEIYFRMSTSFHYSTQDLKRNIIMIGPGTGMSPFVGFLELRKYSLKQNVSLGNAWLFTGCRYKSRNQIFEQEIDTFLTLKVLQKLSKAFSRDVNSQQKYVQDSIKAEKEEFVRWLIEDDSILFVCGEGQKMLPSIEQTVIEVISEVNLCTEEEAVNIVKELKKSRKYIEDIWI